MRFSRITAAVLALSASPAGLLAQGGGDGGLYDINTGLSVWTLVVFAILVFILGKYTVSSLVCVATRYSVNGMMLHHTTNPMLGMRDTFKSICAEL